MGLKKSIYVFSCCFLLQSAYGQLVFNPAQHVNPFIGTGGHGHTFPGATVPFGMVQLSPDTRVDGSWDGCGGYHYSDSIIYGFSHTHLSGTGVSDYGDVAVLPLTGSEYDKFYKKNFKQFINELDRSPNDFKEFFKHKKEKASPGFYSVEFNNTIKAELTTSIRAGIHKYTWPLKETRIVVLKLDHRDKTTNSDIQFSKDNKKITGFRKSEEWARDQNFNFAFEFSEPFEILFCKKSNSPNAKIAYVILKFKKLKSNTPLLIKVGTSHVSVEGAEKNLKSEIPQWDFEKTKNEAISLWNKELFKIEVTSTDKNKLAIFYTALYHCMIHPNIANDVDGNYRGRDGKTHHATHNYYTVFSLWDTFRALHPLLTIIDKKRTSDFIKTFLLQYQQGGRLPVWELASNETDCMIGYHSVSVIADSYSKGIRDFDTLLALEAMQKSANWNHLGLPDYIKKGFLEIDDEHESVSKTLEYGYDDWCIANFASSIGKTKIANTYFERSLAWRNLFDPTSKFIRPRTNGGWLRNFDPREVNNHYTEANAWQYTFFMPHDMNNLILAMGGEDKFAVKLDSLFYGSALTTGRDQPDITGLIGQYAHGNEPSHHMAYLYNYAAQPWKTQELINIITTQFYKNSPDGLIGNEDCGQMSAWYVFSALGIYPVCPGSPEYVYGTPQFERAVIRLENEKKFTFTTTNWNPFSIYLEPVDYYFISHANIAQGGSLNFTMQKEPSKFVIPVEGYRVPKLSVDSKLVLPSPVIQANKNVFRDTLTITMSKSGYRFVRIDYKIWNTKDSMGYKTAEWKEYKNPFTISSDSRIMAIAYGPEKSGFTMSKPIIGTFYKIPNNWNITLNGKYNPQYSAGGDIGIIDGLRGDKNWRKDYWQGYQAQDFGCTIDLKQEKTFYEIGAGFLQDSKSWILFPTQVEYYASKDGKEFTLLSKSKNEVSPSDENVTTQDLVFNWKSDIKYRYIKIIAKNFGTLPSWHIGYSMGGQAFIFVDEVWVK